MPIDPSIALQVKPVELPSPIAQYAQMQRIQASQNQNRLADLMYADKQRDSEQSTALNNIYRTAMGDDGKIDRPKLYSGAAALGLGSRIPGIQKQFLEADDKEADIGHKNAQTKDLTATTSGKEFDLSEKKRQKAISDIAAFNSPADALASLDAHEKAGDLDPQSAASLRAIVPQNPADFPKWQISMLKRIMGAKEAAGYTAPDENTVANNVRIASEGAANRAAQLKAQQMADQRAHDQLEAGRNQVVQSDNGPVLVNTRTGAGKTIMGPDGQPLPGVTKPLTDSQSKALLFGTRMQEADKALAQLASEKVTTSNPGSRMGYGVGATINALQGSNQQMLDQAKRDFMTALLRRESGAAISSGEFETADKQYFPQIGEGPKVVAQKARNRELAINGILAEVPQKQRASITPAPAGPRAAPTANAKGWALHVDAHGNKAYVSPDGKSFEEVK